MGRWHVLCTLLGWSKVALIVRSTDGVEWTTLAEVDDEMMAKCAMYNDLFTGDLGKVSGAVEGGEDGDS